MSQNQVKEEKRARSIAEKARTSVLKAGEVSEAAAWPESDETENTVEATGLTAGAGGGQDMSADGGAENRKAVGGTAAEGVGSAGAPAAEAENSGAAAGPESRASDAGEDKTGETSSLLEELDAENGIRLDLQVDRWDLYAFLMYHTYCSVTGVIGLLLSLFCLGQGIAEIAAGRMNTMTAVLLVVGLWFTVISPLLMIGRSAAQIKRTPSLQKPITYIFTDEGMIQEQGEVKTGCRWKQITKAVFMKRIWILYAGKVRGNVIPVRQLGEHEAELKRLVRAHTGKRSSDD